MSKLRQTPRQNEKVRTLVSDLMHRALEITQSTKHDVFFHYYANVNQVCVDIHVNGFKQGVDAIQIKRNPTKQEAKYNCYIIDGIYLDEGINEVIDFFKVANAEFDKLVASDKAA